MGQYSHHFIFFITYKSAH